MLVSLSDLVFTSHNNVLRFGHDATLLGHQSVPLRPWQAVGSEKAIVLLHTHRGSSQLTPGIVHWQGTSTHKYMTVTPFIYIQTVSIMM